MKGRAQDPKAEDGADRGEETALRRDRRVAAILDGIGDGFFALDREFRLTEFNRGAEQAFGRRRAEVLGLHADDVFPGGTASPIGDAVRHVFATGEVVESDSESIVLPGRWFERRVFPLVDEVGIAFRDATARHAAELRLEAEKQRLEGLNQHLQLMIHELNHRVKNTLATVQSIAAQTLRGAASAEAARESFDRRLIALARAHDVLTAESWQGADLEEVVLGAVEPFRSPARHRFVVSGPRVRLTPKMALALAMALHELGTNAVKYGALLADSGRVHIAWSVDREAPVLRLTWREEGGPPVHPPTRTGFGGRLLQRGLAGELNGETTIDYPPHGVVCTMTAALPSA